jgi:uncharacterized membrane protein YhfC
MTINPFAIIPSLFVFLAGLAALLWWKQKYDFHWKFAALGGGAWLLSILVKSILAILFSQSIYDFLNPVHPWLFYTYIGLLTGVFEIFIPLGIILHYRKKFKGKPNDQLTFGFGFGATEAMALGVLSALMFISVFILLGSSASTDATPTINAIPHDVTDMFVEAYSHSPEFYFYNALLAGIERISAVAIHVFSAFLLFLYVFRKRLEYLLGAIAYKTFVDGAAALFIYEGAEILWVEAFYLVLALLTVAVYFRMTKAAQTSND